MTITGDRPRVVDERALGSLDDADPDVRRTWHECTGLAASEPPEVGLSAGERPTADVEVLAGALAACEYALAARLHAATVGGALPLTAPGAMLRSRGWSVGVARKLARCGELAARHPALSAAWASGIITADHVDPLARAADRFSGAELDTLVAELGPHWGRWSPTMIVRFVEAAARMLHPPPDPTPDEADAYQSRDLSFAVFGDTVLLSGQLPRAEGELVMAAIDALADRLRSTADPTRAGARRADALVHVVNAAHATDVLPTRGGLPVALTVTLQHTQLGDPIWTTSRGHVLTAADARWAGCDAAITPVLIEKVAGPADLTVRPPGVAGVQAGAAIATAARIAALAAALFDTQIPLDVGRTARTATAAQRRALATRDRGCVIPGCGVPAEACQTHHLHEWAAGGETRIGNLVLLCWAHHRQVDLGMWTIEPRGPGSPGQPHPGAPPGTPWPANNGSPWIITRTPRHRWRT